MFRICNHLKTPLKFIKNIHGDMIYTAGGKRSIWVCTNCGKTILMDEPFYMGEVSDGYHTFNELYNHRAVLFSVICNDRPALAWKSKLHHDGTMYDGMFIVGLETPEGQATYHYDVNPYWVMFRVSELPQAPEWDGHTPAQAIERIGKLAQPKNSRQHALQTGVCPMCEDCPDGCPVEAPNDSRNKPLINAEVCIDLVEEACRRGIDTIIEDYRHKPERSEG